MMKIKYPQTPHLPWSNEIKEKDLILPDLGIFNGQTVVISEKLDGENITITKNDCFLQYRDLNYNYDRTLLNEVKIIQKKLIEGYILHGEYLLIKHGIHYNDLLSYLIIYFVEYQGKIINWDTSYKLMSDLCVCAINLYYRGIFDIDYLHNLSKYCDTNDMTEGFVIRVDCDFNLTDMQYYAAKYVRKGFQQIRVKKTENQIYNSLRNV